MNRTVILGTGAAVPNKVLTNKDLETIVDTSDEWISTRTGIKSRYIAEDGETTSTLATEAARRSLDMAGVRPAEVDMIIVGTTSPDMVMPNTGALVQKHLGASNAFAFDVYAACSGFVYGLDIANRYMATGGAKKALVIGAEKDHRLAVELMARGAGAYYALPDDVQRLEEELSRRVAVLASQLSEAQDEHPRSDVYDFGAILGQDPSLSATLKRAARVIPGGRTTVLITGETGTGKELLAQAIHANGPRSNQPFASCSFKARPVPTATRSRRTCCPSYAPNMATGFSGRAMIDQKKSTIVPC